MGRYPDVPQNSAISVDVSSARAVPGRGNLWSRSDGGAASARSAPNCRGRGVPARLTAA